jgi:3-dehydrotetronate 4-kinase
MCDRLAVIADDLTGSMDAAIMMWIEGWRVGVVEAYDAIAEDAREWDAVIFSAATRGVGPADAYAATRAGTAAFQEAGFARFYKKMSSTVQGNVGSELDAVLDAAGETFAVVVPAFPQNGRTTRGGVHYVRGVPVAETSLRYHPTSPITTSYLPDLLAAQTRRRIRRLDLDVIRRGLPAIGEELSRLHTDAELVLADAETIDDVGVLAAATGNVRVLAGASAFAGALRPPRERRAAPARMPRVDGPVLIVAGSVSETTAEQVRVAVAGGVPAVDVDVERLRVAPQDEVGRVVDAATRVLGEAPAVLIHTLGETLRDASRTAPPEADPAAARDFGARVGTHLGEIVRRIRRGGLGALIIAGGDTSASVSARVGFVRHSIVAPFQMGVPITLSEGRSGQALLTVMKSGNFGASDFFLSVLSALRAFQT